MSFRTRILATAIPAICSGIVVFWLLYSTHADMNIPVAYSGDALYELAIFKGIGEGNPPWRNPRLAAPFGGSDWRDYPLYQWIDYSAFRFLSLFTTNYLKLLNWYWLLTIAATAGIAAFAFLRLRAGPVVAGCLGFLYGLQPYVFARSLYHFNLVCYLVPLLAAACVEVAIGRWEKGKMSALREIPLYAWLGFLLQGISFFYFSFFAALLLPVAALFGACARRTLRPLIHTAVLLVVLVVGTIGGMSPTLLHWLQHGTNPAAVGRSAAEAEVHGLRIRHLLTPVPGHPVRFMRNLWNIAKTEHQDHTEATTTCLGLLGAVGFVALITYLFAALAGWRSPLDDGTVVVCGVLTLSAFLWCTVGGFGSVFNTFISPVIRAYDRIIVFLVFFILAAYGVVVSAALARKQWARTHPVAVAVALIFVTTLAFFDALWAPTGIQFPDTRANFASDRAYFSSIEHALGGQGMVFQLPYADYPTGGGPGKILPFDHARPYLTSSTNLQWSWGTVLGTEEARLMRGISELPPESLMGELRRRKFRGLLIDTYGYTDNGPGMPAKAFAALLGQEPIASNDGRFLFFNLGSSQAQPPPPVESSSPPFKISDVRPGSSCSVDLVNDLKPPSLSAAADRATPVHLEGWVADVEGGVALPEVYIEIWNAAGTRFYLHARRFTRSDVAAYFHKPSMTESGYTVTSDLSTLAPGAYHVRILQASSGTVQSCKTDFQLELR